jgi:ATP/maltotriose-dependent transcriptional regulator MalT
MADLTLEAARVHEAGIFADLAVTHALEAKDPHLMNLASEVKQRVRAKKSEFRP